MSNNPGLSVSITGLQIDLIDCWIATSPDGLIKDPSEPGNTDGLLEIKCPFLAESTCLMDICNNKKHKSYFCLKLKKYSKLSLKHKHNYYYLIHGQIHITRRKWCDFV